jgi:hypothetical protein
MTYMMYSINLLLKMKLHVHPFFVDCFPSYTHTHAHACPHTPLTHIILKHTQTHTHTHTQTYKEIR